MSRPVITMGPTMANPNAFGTVPELRAELARVNAQVFDLAFRLHDMSARAQYFCDHLVMLIKAHHEGDAERLRAALDEMTAQYLREQKAREATH